MSLGIIFDLNGERSDYLRYRIAPKITPTTSTKPVGYMGQYHWEDYYSKVPIMCMRGNPDIRTIMALACKPNPAEIERRARLGLNVKLPILETKAPNGTTVRIDADENGDVIAVTEKTNLAPLIMLGGLAAWLFFT